MHSSRHRTIALLLLLVAPAALFGGSRLAVAIDAGAGTPPFPVDMSRAFSQIGLYLEDIDIDVDGDDIAAAPDSWANPFFVEQNPLPGSPQMTFTPCSVFWGTGSTQLDSGGIPLCNVFAVVGQTVAAMIARAPANVDRIIDAKHHKNLIYNGGLNDGVAGASASTICARLQTYGQDRLRAGWAHVWLIGMLDSPALPSGLATSVNACLRAGWVGWGLSGFADVGPGGPLSDHLGLTVGAVGDAGDDRTWWFNGDGGDGSLPSLNGRVAYTNAVMVTLYQGTWQ